MTDPLGLLPSTDPLGLIPEERQFQSWYAGWSKKIGLNPDPDDPQHFYDYRAAFKAGAEPTEESGWHWPSEFKREGNPRMIVDGVDTRTGNRIDQEFFSTWWSDFLENDSSNREKIFYSLVTAQETGLPPSIIYDNTEKPPANWMRQNEVTLTKTIREILEIPKSLAEVGLTFASGAVGWGVSSILGIAEATKPGASRESVRAVMEDAGRRIVYEPQTRPARDFLGRAGRLIQAVVAPAGEAAALVGESWDSPFLEAVLRFAGEAAIFNLIGKGAEKIQKPPDWYYRLTVKERDVVEGIKADISSGELTPEQVRYLWKDPANRAELLKRYQGVQERPIAEAAPEPQAPMPPSGIGSLEQIQGTGKPPVRPIPGVKPSEPVISESDYAAEAAQAGVVFNGLQETGEGKRPLPLFTDPVTKSTFTLPEGETIPDVLAKVREKFQKKAPSKEEIVQPGAELEKEKQTWEMTRDEWEDIFPTENAEITHRDVVEEALAEGKPVPPEVLKDYPELAKGGVYRARGLEDAIKLRQQEPQGSLANYDERSQKEWLRGQTPPKDGKITLYRATPTGKEIKPGDYVTNSLQYAQDHIEANLGKGKITKIEATLDDIYPADGPGEFWYAPKSIETTPKAVGGINTKAEEFTNWFGDSVVVNEKHEPKKVYRWEYPNSSFANKKSENIWFSEETDAHSGEGKNFVKAYIKIENPLEIPGIGEPGEARTYDAWMEIFKDSGIDTKALKFHDEVTENSNPMYFGELFEYDNNFPEVAMKAGYDGVISPSSSFTTDHTEYIVFNPDQIKSLPKPSRPPGGTIQYSIKKAEATEGEVAVSRGKLKVRQAEPGLQNEPLEAPEDINALFEAAARTDVAVAPPVTSEYDKIRTEAARIAYEKLSKKLDLQKRRETRAVKRQGIEDARQDPVYTTIQEIVKQGGLNRDKLLTTFDKDTVKELSRKRVGLVTKEGKLGLDEIAEDHGFVSDEALMSMMLDWKGLGEAGKKAAAEFEERYSDLMSEAEKEDFHLSLLEEEAKILRGMLKQKAKPSAPGIKKVIREQTGQTRVDELMISEYEALKAGMKKAELAARKAFREGKLDGALAEKERQIEMALARKEKLQAKQEAKDIHDGIIKLTKDKAIPEDYQDRIQDLLEDFDLLPRSGKMAKRVESAREFLERQKQAGEDVTIPESMLNRIERYGKTHWRELTLDQLTEIYEQAQMYAHLGKLKNKLIAQKEKRDFEAVVATIVTEIGKNWGVKPVSPVEMETIFLDKTFGEKLSDFKESYLASLTKIETYLRRLDGFKDLGPIWEAVYLPVKQASDVEYRRLQEITKELRELFDPVKKSLTKEKFRIPGVDQFLTRETVVMAAMNSGNEGNLNALQENRVYNWDGVKIQAVLDKVTPEEWALVRGVWDMFEKQYPDLEAVYKNLSGTTLKKVEGDYFPLVFDRRLSWIADRNATEAELRDFFKSIYTLPSVKTGSTIERVGGKLPPKLKFSVIFEKLAEINHYITHAEAVRDVQKILADPRVRAAIEGAPNGIGGPEAYREMMNWLQDVARQQKDPMTAVEAAVKTARINTSVVAMGWKFSTAVVQFLGWGNTIYKVGLGESTKALAEFYTNREAMVEMVKGMSAEMSGRAKSFDRELRDAYARIGLDQFRGSQAMKDSFFSLISTMDMAVAYPTWVAAYNKGMKDFAGDEAKAIDFADLTTRMTQGTALVKDLAGIQRGAELKKILSMFYTFFSSYHQMMADAWLKFKFDKTGQNFGDLMRAWWWLTILPATVDYMMKEREIPGPGEFLKNVLQMRLTAYPVIRDMTGAVLTDYDYQMSPVSRAGEVVGRFAKEISKAVTPDEEMEWDKLLRYGLESAGYMTGLPTGQAVVTMNGLMDLLNGETSDVTRLLMRAPREENE